MKLKVAIGKLGGFFLAASASCGLHAGAVLNTADASNGITSIYSSTFDGGRSACTGSSPPYCSSFGGDPPATHHVTIVPTPTGVLKGVPGGIGCGAPCPPSANPVPGAGSYLKLALSAGNTVLTLTGGTIFFPDLTLNIDGENQGGGTAAVTASKAGIVFDPAPQVGVPTATPRQWQFLVDLSPAAAVDFSAFQSVVTSCEPSAGTLCGLIPLLTLDMVRYWLLVTYDPAFSTFTGSFAGQTANFSMVFANLNSVDVTALNSDGDTVPNAVDNCTAVTNEDQRDTNADGYGNMCDPDFNGDGIVANGDYLRLKARLNISPVVDVDTDLDGNTVVNVQDYLRLKSYLNKNPGPSGLHPNCPPTCP